MARVTLFGPLARRGFWLRLVAVTLSCAVALYCLSLQSRISFEVAIATTWLAYAGLVAGLLIRRCAYIGWKSIWLRLALFATQSAMIYVCALLIFFALRNLMDASEGLFLAYVVPPFVPILSAVGLLALILVYGLVSARAPSRENTIAATFD